MMWEYGHGWGTMFLMSLGMIFWVALLAVLAWALIHWLSGNTSAPTTTMRQESPNGPSAEEILRQRYARGEIDTATFVQMREQLQASGPPRS